MLASAPGMARPRTLILQAGQFLLQGGPFRAARLSTLIAQDAQDHVLAPVGFFEQRCEPLEFSMALGVNSPSIPGWFSWSKPASRLRG